MDYALFKIINGWAGRWPALDLLARMFVNDYFVPSTMSLGLLFLWFGGRTMEERDRWQGAVIESVFSLFLANALVKVFNAVIFRPRPYFDHNVRMLFYHPSDSSWPSNPAAVTFAIAATIWFYNRRAGAAMLALAGLMALARVVAGVHYPGDVFSGALLGMGVAYGLYRQENHLQPYVEWLIHLGRQLHLA